MLVIIQLKKIFSSHLLSETLKLRIQKTIILTTVLHGYRMRSFHERIQITRAEKKD
jgi:hypothetical protein